MPGYKPNGMGMWDTWFVVHKGTAHVYHLQRKNPGSTRTKLEEDSIGHATSTDLIHWNEQAPALPPGSAEQNDDLQPWTGCTVEHEGVFYMYYTMRGKKDNGLDQRIGLAISDDLFHWKRYENNPVITPDPRWYMGRTNPRPNGKVDCRDLVVVRDRDQWLGFYAATLRAEEVSESGVIAAVRSKDLIHWEHLPPAFSPGKYCVLEVPDVFELDGRWYMTCLAGNGYGNRGVFSDPYAIRGTVYAVSDNPAGPYHEFKDDNVLICGNMKTGYSCRSVEFSGERYAFYTQPTTGGDTLSPPMQVRTTDYGKLRLQWAPASSVFRKETLLPAGEPHPISRLPFCSHRWFRTNGRWHAEGTGYIGECRSGWQVADICPSGPRVEVEAQVSIQEAKAVGLVLRSDITMERCCDSDLVFMAEPDSSIVRAARTQMFEDPFFRKWDFFKAKTCKLRVCARPPWYEFYIDDVLALQFNLDLELSENPGVGLFVDRGRTEIDNLAVYGLHVYGK